MTFILNRGLSEALFEGFFIQRWNDRLRPVNLTEADKNSSKMMLCLFIGKLLEDKGEDVNWEEIVNKGIYDALTRYALSDISSVVHSKLRENPEAYVISILKVIEKQYSKLLPEDFLDRYKNYITEEKTSKLSQSDFIIRLGHQLSLRQEFKIVRSIGYGSFFLPHEENGDEIDRKINEICNELGIEEILNSQGEIQLEELNLTLKLIDRLRYQTRWSQTPRVPNTNRE